MVQLNFRTKKNGVPILSKNEIEEIAEIVMRDYDADILEEPRSLDIDHFSECYAELEMDYQDLTNDQSILGMMVFNDCRIPVYDAEENKAKRITVYEGTVLIDNSLLEDDQLRRGRFTLSHEVSHWFLHRQIYKEDKNQMSLFDFIAAPEKQPIIKCRSVDIESNRRKELVTDDDWMEWQADYMSSALLMPKKSFSKAIRKKFKSAGIKNGYYKMGTDFEQDLWAEVLHYELADIFDVSVTAAKIRLKNLGFIKDEQESRQYSLGLDS
jgi:Zn-dependent peptidase ImmA (M78 family)